MKFNMTHHEGRLLATVTVDGKEHTDDVTAFFEESDVFAEWLTFKSQQIANNERKVMGFKAEQTVVHDEEPAYSSIGQYNVEMKNKIEDCYYDVHGIKPSMPRTMSIAMNLPRNIHSLAKEWGWSDTEVGDQVYLFIQNLIEE